MTHQIFDLWTTFELKIGAVFSLGWVWITEMIGGFDEQISALVILTALDILSGIWSACKTHTFESHIAYQGLTKKGVMFLIIGLGILLDTAMHTELIRTLFIGAFAIIEALSLMENVDKLGYGHYIPEFLRGWLAQIAKERGIIKKDDKKSN